MLLCMLSTYLLLTLVSCGKVGGDYVGDNAKSVNFRHFRAEDAKILAALLVKLRKPLTLHITDICWTQRQLTEFSKSLHKDNISTRRFTNKQLNDWKNILKKKEDVAFFVDLSCDLEAKNTLTIANITGAYLAPLTWILLKTSSQFLSLNDLNLFLPVSSRVYLIEKQDSNFPEYNITSLYTLPHIGVFVNSVAYINRHQQFLYFTHLSDARHRRNLRKLVINSTAVVTHPSTMNHQLDGKERHIDPVFKFAYPQTLHLFDYCNGTARMGYTNTWGYGRPDGTFKESMMKHYQDGIIEIAASAVFILKNRLPYVSFYQKLPTEAAFTFRPPPLSSVKNIYLLPYSLEVWCACAAILVVFVITFYVITYMEQRLPDMQRRSNTAMSQLENKMADLVHMDLSVMCQQGMEAEPSSLGGRVATYIMLLSTLFLFIAYSANILTLMQSTSDQINSMDALYDSKIKIGVEDVPYSRFLLKTADEAMMQKIYNDRIAPPGKPDGFINPLEGVRRMRNEFYAYHAETTVIYKFIEQEFLESEKCGLSEIQYFKVAPCGGCKRSSPYKEIFANGYRKFDEYGIASREFRRIYIPKPKCTGSAAIFASVSMMDTYAAYLIFYAGVIFGWMVFAGEQFYWRRVYGQWFLKTRNMRSTRGENNSFKLVRALKKFANVIKARIN